MDLAELARQTALEIAEGTAVIFLGVGASVGTIDEREEGKGIVGSDELTRAIADRFGIELKLDAAGALQSTLRGVASRAVRERDPNTVKRFVIEKIAPGCGKPLKAHRALAQVAPTIVVTTNYDDLYESAMREADKDCEKIVQSADLARLPHTKPRVLKLHGDFERPREIVLTGEDYRGWRKKAAGLQAEVVATLQKYVCVFVGYSVRDENLQDILKIIEDNLGSDVPKHFAVVHEVDDEQAAELAGVIEFVRGDATEFFEALAEEHTGLSPQPRDPARERADFEAHLASGDLEEAGESCKALADYLEARGESSGAASLWHTFGEAASAADEHVAAAAAFEEAGRLLWESGYPFDADRVLSASLREAQTAAEPTVEQRIQGLLQRVRLSAGNYYDVLQETEAALRSSGDDAPPSLVYALRETRAEAQEMLHGLNEALDEYRATLDQLPDDALYFRTKASASVVRLLADKYEWGQARQALDAAETEVSESESDEEERRRCDAILTLVEANVHQALGEDESALRRYEDCASVLEELDETALAVSALQGFMDSSSHLLHDPPAETIARLSDLARDSREHRRIADLERQGISQLAEGDVAGGNLAAARDSLARAEAAAKAVHSQRSTRRVQIWYSDVLLRAGFSQEALLSYIVAGERTKVIEVARDVRRTLPTGGSESTNLFDDLLELASKGAMHSRGPAFAALKELWDVFPDGMMPEAVGYLSNLDALNSFVWVDREVLAYAADLAYAVAPRLDDGQASRVGAALVTAILRDDVYWTAHRAACLALARLADLHPAVLSELEVPVRRLAEMADPDTDRDTVRAMVALVTLARAGNEEAETEALWLLESADGLSRARWRHVLGSATEDELALAIREWLPRSISRVRTAEGVTGFGIGRVSPMFLQHWPLPESVKEDVARTLSEAVVDATVVLPHRQAAALILGLKAAQFGGEDRVRAFDALMAVLTVPFEAHDAVKSIDNPLSMLRTNIGQEGDVVAAAGEALLHFSGLVDEGRRQAAVREVSKLRAGQVEPIGLGVADGLRHFVPRSDEEKRWLRTRLLLLLESYHPSVRQATARSLSALVEGEAVGFDAEILAAVLFLAEESSVEDRAAAASTLASMARSGAWHGPRIEQALRSLRGDPSYLVRSRVQDLS